MEFWMAQSILKFLIAFLFSLSFVVAQVPHERMEKLKQGVSISHWFWLPVEPTMLIDRYIIPEDIQEMKKLGFRHVRIPFEMANLERVELVELFKKSIEKFLNQGVAVVIAAFGDKYNKEFIKYGNAPKLLEKLCQDVVKHFSPEWVFVQIANEPWVDDPQQWSTIQDNLIKAARAILPKHTLITSTPLKYGPRDDAWSMLEALYQSTPSEDPNVVYGFHFYEPFYFTHQGAHWDPNTKFVKGLKYPSTEENSKTVLESMDPAAPDWLKEMLKAQWNKEKLRKALEPVLKWREKFKRPVMVTEFGVYKHFADRVSTLQWADDVTALFKEYQIPWSYWDYVGGFGLTYPENNLRKFDMELITALKMEK
jgi:aryl-phospho-beta-D-glucosidase BglC (GH1 family)